MLNKKPGVGKPFSGKYKVVGLCFLLCIMILGNRPPSANNRVIMNAATG
jgi:hypothetical protein